MDTVSRFLSAESAHGASWPDDDRAPAERRGRRREPAHTIEVAYKSPSK